MLLGSEQAAAIDSSCGGEAWSTGGRLHQEGNCIHSTPSSCYMSCWGGLHFKIAMVGNNEKQKRIGVQGLELGARAGDQSKGLAAAVTQHVGCGGQVREVWSGPWH